MPPEINGYPNWVTWNTHNRISHNEELHKMFCDFALEALRRVVRQAGVAPAELPDENDMLGLWANEQFRTACSTTEKALKNYFAHTFDLYRDLVKHSHYEDKGRTRRILFDDLFAFAYGEVNWAYLARGFVAGAVYSLKHEEE